jgi:hypothetical protein
LLDGLFEQPAERFSRQSKCRIIEFKQAFFQESARQETSRTNARPCMPAGHCLIIEIAKR